MQKTLFFFEFLGICMVLAPSPSVYSVPVPPNPGEYRKMQKIRKLRVPTTCKYPKIQTNLNFFRL